MNNNSSYINNGYNSAPGIAEYQQQQAETNNYVNQAAPVEESVYPETSLAQDNLNDVPMSDDPQGSTPEEPGFSVEDILKSFETVAATGESSNYNKMGISVPLSDMEKMSEAQTKEYADCAAQNKLEESLVDLTSPLQSIHASMDMFSAATNVLQESLKKIVDPKSTLAQQQYMGIGDAPAKVFDRYSDGVKTVTGREAWIALNTLTSGIRRITLWNSGIRVTMRAVPMELLNEYSKEVSTDAYEYGKNFGAYYYLFQDLTLVETIVNKLLRVAVCGSTYETEYNDQMFNRLLNLISWQDFHTLLLAMATMLHPNGQYIRYACGECGHVEEQFSDLSKLHVLDTSMINSQMIDHFKKAHVNDADLEKYREACKLNRDIEFSYSQGDVVKKWKFTLKQCTVAEYLAVGREFNAELRKKIDVTDTDEINTYMVYNGLRCFRPWISELTLTVITPDGKEANVRYVNDPSAEKNTDTLNMILDELQNEYPKFADLMRDYITSTQISKIAMYYPKCTKCGKEPSLSADGFIPFDPMMIFFILVLRRLYRRSAENI